MPTIHVLSQKQDGFFFLPENMVKCVDTTTLAIMKPPIAKRRYASCRRVEDDRVVDDAETVDSATVFDTLYGNGQQRTASDAYCQITGILRGKIFDPLVI